MDIETLREFCLRQPGVTESMPFGDTVLVFKVQGKIFLLASLDTHPLQFNVKCEPERALELRDTYDCIQPGYHMNKKHWNTVVVNGQLSTAQLEEQILHSYTEVVRKMPKPASSPKKKPRN